MHSTPKPHVETIPAHLHWHASPSSNVAAYAHDRAADRLYVRFKSGGVGYYANVMPSMFVEMQQATSHGTFVHERLKGNDEHPWHRIDNEDDGQRLKIKTKPAPEILRTRGQ